MSRTLVANFGSLEILKLRMRFWARPWAFQMRCTEVRLTPAALAISARALIGAIDEKLIPVPTSVATTIVA